jgi:hypothetical protein
MAGDGVDADVHDLDIECRKTIYESIESGHLRGSSRRPINWMKHDQDVFLASKIL